MSFSRFTFRPHQQKYIHINHISDIHVWNKDFTSADNTKDDNGSSKSLFRSLVMDEWRSGQQQLQNNSKNNKNSNARDGMEMSPFSWWRDLKRFQGYANLAWWRDVPKRYPIHVLSAALKDMISRDRELVEGDSAVPHHHMLLTGDITNIALESEFAHARELLQELYIDPALAHTRSLFDYTGSTPSSAAAIHGTASVLTTIPGNHDTYVPSALANNWFGKYFGDTLYSDQNQPDNAQTLPSFHSQFPAIKQLVPELEGVENNNEELGSVTLICLNSGLPTKPFIARGYLTQPVDQLARAAEILKRENLSPAENDSPAHGKSFKIVLIHHPPVVRTDQGYDEFSHGLDNGDKEKLAQFCQDHNVDLVINGHTHIPYVGTIPNITNQTLVIDPGSGTQVNTEKPHQMARYNVYRIDLGQSRLESVTARVYDPSTGSFHSKKVKI